MPGTTICRAADPIWRWMCAPPAAGVSESSAPFRIRTGTPVASIDAWVGTGGSAGWVGFGQLRQPVIRLGVGQHAQPLAGGERGERVGRQRREWPAPIGLCAPRGPSACRTAGGSPSTRPPCTARRSSSGRGLVVGVVVADVLCVQAGERGRVAMVEVGADGGVELAVGVGVVAGVVDDVDQRGDVQAHRRQVARRRRARWPVIGWARKRRGERADPLPRKGCAASGGRRHAAACAHTSSNARRAVVTVVRYQGSRSRAS